MSIDDQFYKNEHGFIGLIDQKIMLFARDIAIFLRWLTGKNDMLTLSKYIYYFGILYVAISIYLIWTSWILLIIMFIMEIMAFNKAEGLLGKGTRWPKGMKIMFLCVSLVFIIMFSLDSKIYPPLTGVILAFNECYFQRVELPPATKETAKNQIKELLKKLQEILKPAPQKHPLPS